jgi:hypothetical protein
MELADLREVILTLFYETMQTQCVFLLLLPAAMDTTAAELRLRSHDFVSSKCVSNLHKNYFVSRYLFKFMLYPECYTCVLYSFVNVFVV